MVQTLTHSWGHMGTYAVSMTLAFILECLLMVHVLLAPYVDDMLVTAKSKLKIVKLKPLLCSEFDRKDLGFGLPKRSLELRFTVIGGLKSCGCL